MEIIKEDQEQTSLISEIKEIYIKTFPSNLFQKKIDVMGLAYNDISIQELKDLRDELNNCYTEFQKQLTFKRKFFFPIYYTISKLKQPFSKNVTQYYKNIKSEINLRKDFMYNLFFYPEYIMYMTINIYLEDAKKIIEEKITMETDENIVEKNTLDNEIFNVEEENEKECLRSLFPLLLLIFLDDEVLNLDDENKLNELTIKIDRILENIQFLSLGIDGKHSIIYTIILLILKNTQLRENVAKISHPYRFKKLIEFLEAYEKNNNNTFCLLSTDLDLNIPEGYLKTVTFFNKLSTCYMSSFYNLMVEPDKL